MLQPFELGALFWGFFSAYNIIIHNQIDDYRYYFETKL